MTRGGSGLHPPPVSPPPATEAAVTETAGGDNGVGAAGGQRSSFPLSVVGLAVPVLIGAVRLVLTIRRPFDHAGDHAIFEAAIRRVASGAQALGPYSRFGFHQPGPAYFEVQAPFYWLSGSSARALFLGAVYLNLGSALASVAVVRRFLGESAARWTAVVVGAYLVMLTPALTADPWPAYVLALPFLLTLLLAAAAAAGSVTAAAGALVCGSYLVQTHVATAGTVVAVVVTAGVVAATRRRSSDNGGRARGRRRLPAWAVLVSATAILAVMWIPPLVEEATHTPGNLTELVRFFNHSHPEFDEGYDHGLRASAGQVARQLTLLPLGRRADRGPARPLDVAAACAGLLASAAVVVAGKRRRDRFLVALGLISLVGTVTAVWSATRIVGAVLPYLLLWTSVVLLPAWIGAGALVAAPRRRATSLVLAAGVGAVAAASGWSMLRAPLPPLRSAADVTAASTLARGWLANHGVHHVRVRLGEHVEWPLAAGVIVRLQKDGLAVTVDDNYTALFGDQFAPSGSEDATLWLTPAKGTPPPGQAAERLGDAAGSVVWAGPMNHSGGGHPG